MAWQMGEELPTEEQELELALTRRMLTALGIESEKIDQIIEAHTESTDALKAKAEEADTKAEQFKQAAARVPVLEKQIEDLKAADNAGELEQQRQQAEAEKAALQKELDELKGSKMTLESEFEAFKQQVADEKADAEKLTLYKALLRDIGLDEKRVEKAARLKPLSELTVEDGKLAGYDELKAAEAEEWADFIAQKKLVVPPVATPPKSDGPTGANPLAMEIAQQRHERMYGKSEE